MTLDSFYRDAVGVDDASLRARLVAASSVVELGRREQLIGVGDEQMTLSFLVSGVLCSCGKNARGVSSVDCFIFRPGTPLVPCPSILEPSSATILALDCCQLVSVPLSEVMELLEVSLAANKLYVRLLAEAWQQQQGARVAMNQLSGRERLLWFREAYPGLEDRVPGRYLASFLDMTPVSLSRLRSSLRDERGEPAASDAEGDEA